MKNVSILVITFLTCLLFTAAPCAAEQTALAEKPQYTEWLTEKNEMWLNELAVLEGRAEDPKFNELRELIREIQEVNKDSIQENGHHDSPSARTLLRVMYVEKELQEAFASYPVEPRDALTLR